MHVKKSKELILQVFPVPRFDFYHLTGPIKHSDISQHLPVLVYVGYTVPSHAKEIAGATGSEIYEELH
jgi:hypothetical protein